MRPLASLLSLAALLWCNPSRANPRILTPVTETMPTINGLYPLWEHTGEVHPWLHFQIGYHHAQLGLGRVQLGTQPVLDIYGTFNAQVKVALRRTGRLRIAAEIGWYRVPSGAQSRTIGNLHTVHLVNPYQSITLLPVSLAMTWLPLRWLRVHVSATALVQWAQEPQSPSASAGLAAIVEARANERWSAMAHLGVEGMGVAVEEHVGISLVYRHRYCDLRVGYARRFAGGESGNLILWDVAVVY